MMSSPEDLHSATVVDAAIAVHRHLGPGALESAYKLCLAWELRDRGLIVETEVPMPLRYKGVTIDAGYRVDILVGGALILELKVAAKILPVHEAQLLTYLRLSGLKLGLLLNFQVPLMKDGIKRVVNGL